MNPNDKASDGGSFLPKSPQDLEMMVQRNLAQLPGTADHERAVIYSRVSSIETRKHSYSMEYQPDQSEEYVKGKGWRVVAAYSDPDRTGRNSRRPGLQALIRDIEKGKATVVVVHRLDRLYRNLESLLRFLRFLRRLNVRLVSVTEQIDTDTWWGRLVLYILGALAEMYVWQSSIRTREIKVERARQGLHNGMAPYGYCKGLCSACVDHNGPGYCPQVGQPDRLESQRGRILVPHPVDRHAVLMIHTLYDQGHSFLDIAHLLNTHEYQLPDGNMVRFRTKGVLNPSPGRPFQRDSIRDIILNDFYVGYIVRRPSAPLDMDDERAPASRDSSSGRTRQKTGKYLNRRAVIERNIGQHEAIVPEGLWERNQNTRKSRRNAPHTKDSPIRDYLLSSTAWCWECYQHDGRRVRLRGLSTNGHNYYRCATLQQEYSSRKKSRPEFGKVLDTLKMEASPNGMGKDLLVKHRANLRQDLMEAQINQLMEQVVIPVEWYDIILAYLISPTGLNDYRLKRFNLINEIAQVHERRALRAITQAEYERTIVEITRELNQLQPTMQPEVQEFIPLLRDFKTFWRMMDITHRRLILESMFDGLYFDHDHRLRKVAMHSPFEMALKLGALGDCLDPRQVEK